MKKISIIKAVICSMAKMVPAAFVISAVYVLAASAWEAVSPAVISVLLGRMSRYSGGEAKEITRVICLYVAGFFLIQIVQTVGSVTDNNCIYEKSGLLLKRQVIEHAGRISPYDHENSDILNLIRRAYECVALEAVPNVWRGLIDMAGQTISLAGILATLFYFHPSLIAVAVISTLPTLWVKIIQGGRSYALAERQTADKRKREEIWKLFMDTNAMTEVHMYDAKDYLKHRWNEENKKITEEVLALEKHQARQNWRLSLMKSAGYIVGIGISIWLTFEGKLEIGQLGACLIAFSATQKLADDILVRIGRLSGYLPYAADYYAFLNTAAYEERGDTEVSCLKEEIRFRDLSFSYPNEEKYALKKINLSIKKGETVAIVGANGSGKSTLAKVLLGLYPYQEGSLYYDGMEYRTIKKTSLYRQFTQVSQNFIRYYMTLRDNVKISDLDANYEEDAVLCALSDAGAGDLPGHVGGLDRWLGRMFGGTEISGGQWQRLAIARGFYRKRKVMVLDEPTSALDPNMENDFLNRLLELTRGKTAVIISHRVSLCPKVDRVIVMDRGEIVEAGSHEELMRLGGVYKSLYESQRKWYVEACIYCHP